jgi:hypothetical protein
MHEQYEHRERVTTDRPTTKGDEIWAAEAAAINPIRYQSTAGAMRRLPRLQP